MKEKKKEHLQEDARRTLSWSEHEEQRQSNDHRGEGGGERRQCTLQWAWQQVIFSARWPLTRVDVPRCGILAKKSK